MKKNERGFTLVELMITMVVFVLVIAAASNIFSSILNQYKQQSKIAETNIEGSVGLAMMGRDIEQAGYGLPWSVDLDGTRQGAGAWTALTRFCEAASVVSAIPNPANYNDGATILSTTTCDTSNVGIRAPRAIVAGNNTNTVMNNSDYLVIKATTLAVSDTAQKWTRITNTAAGNVFMTAFGTTDEDLETSDRVIVVLPTRGVNKRILLTDSSGSPFFYTLFNNNVGTFSANRTAAPLVQNSALVPFANSFDTFMIYGVDHDTDLRMPFNRADYYISNSNVPSQCAANTGVLIKSVINQADGGRTGLPLLDCVADMQVVLRLDLNDDGNACTVSDADGNNLAQAPGCTGTAVEALVTANVQATLGDAALLRQRLKQIRVYVLAHEGQRDLTYTFNNFTGGGTSITVGNAAAGDTAALTSNFDLTAITNYLNYRWKVYTLVITPYNLR